MMKTKRIIIQMILIFSFCLFSDALQLKALAASEDDVVTKGVYIDSVDISGMTKEEAVKAVNDYVDTLKSKSVTVTIDDKNKEVISLKDLGYNNLDSNYIDEALSIGKSGNLIKRYKETKDTEESKVVYPLEYRINDDKLKKFVEEKCKSYDIDAVNATVERKNGAFVYTDDTIGRKLNSSKTIDAIKTAILNEWDQNDLTIAAVVEDDLPKYTKEMVEKCNTILGSFSTTYTTSSADRAGNLANGARLINNTVLYPGDVFSAYDKLTPFTISNGYYQAGAYANGKVIDSIGGGACQVTTTLYNAVLLSELDVVERANHSMTISYVDLSRDSAIAGTWKDLKFENNTDTPVVIEAYTQGRTITFNIWGNETRDTKNRKIKFETVVLSEKAPGADVVTKDPTKPTTYQVTTQSAHTGYVAELYKIVYENGVEVSRNRVNKSVYNASPRYVTVGTMEVEEEKPADENKDDSEPTSAKPAKTEEEPADNSSGNAENSADSGISDSTSNPDNQQETDTPGNENPVDNQEDSGISE